ncbi:glycerophosphodiester phosphodiesterase family protein [Oricola thermophila]|uniref:Glycerophosphodiester phosphodiesterase n=1 Tax=Oricola thermophila TaxID=2742145 RepID=A0A6N1VGH5_9HYPH|nr:glycerophosphodiester phosphodiesterase family protein [Oricola thermophila]QKV18097.1 glycerophosphodiester phosphodiesterase [Oricola thermophila]
MLDFLTRRPIAHRGLHDDNVLQFENSLSAFSAAANRDFAIELDVQLSGDGTAVVFHDRTLERLTSRAGPVVERTASELRKIRLGSTNEHIPVLAETLECIDGSVPVVIEMKEYGANPAALARAVAIELESYSGQVAVMSFGHSLLSAFAETGSDAPLGLTAEGIGRHSLAEHNKALAIGISFVSYHVKALPNPFVDHVRKELGLPVITWTVRNHEDVEATRLHADQITFEGFDPDLQ